MECRWNAGGRVRMRLRRLPSEDERFRRAAAVAAVAAVRHVGMSACRHVGMSAARPVAHCAAQSCAEPRAIAVLEMPRGQRRRRESNRAQRAGRVLSRPIGATFAMRIVKERGERREVARVYHPGRLEGWKAGRLEGWKAGRREGGKAGRLEGWKAGRREGGKAWDGVRPFAPSYVVVHRDEGRGAHYRRGRWQRPGSSRVNRRRALGGFGFGFGFGCVGTACVRLKRVTCPHPAACRARSPMRWGRRAPSAERRAPRGSCSNPARTRISSRASGARRAGRSRPRCDAARRMRAACSAPPFTCGRGTARCRCA
ncbi:Uncharacterised protein [Burkholderia pseudomallei]|nr:Uncharacterised protein [Burkholderia pseudomallei]CAJ3347215.1 Uncharacterised protein [Burkholderia pseudomallei]